MSLFPEYNISTKHPKYYEVFDEWAIDIVAAISESYDRMNVYFEDSSFQMQFCNSTNRGYPETVIPRDIKKFIKDHQETNYDTTFMLYDPEYVNLDRLQAICDEFTSKRRKKDVVLSITSAYLLTHTLNQDLLDKPIPRASVLAISYCGPKTSIG